MNIFKNLTLLFQISLNRLKMTYYDIIAAGYDELHESEQKNKLSIVKENLQTNKNNLLLDVGCGSGISSNFDCNVIGIDSSFELLKIAKQRFSNKSDKHNKHNKCFIQAKAENMPLKKETFDIIVSLTAIHNFDDIEKTLSEIKRTAKENCKFVFSVLKKSSKLEKIQALIEKYFKIKNVLIEDKDLIVFCELK